MTIEPADRATVAGIGPPLWLLAELTYRCPLHCVFCYNPVDFARDEAELSTEDWLRVLGEARALGILQFKLDILWSMNDAMALAYGVGD